ncbi:MAG: response regulator [Ectothiorhodospiraceae bacterium]|nr:response regulator [Chromatiales bacterium]MCP5153748.1 response regulator [Ectothiorhodospiraceae bacterium]
MLEQTVEPAGSAVQRLDGQRARVALLKHELRTPVAAILGFCRLLAENGEIPTELRRHLEQAHAAASQLDHLVERVVRQAEETRHGVEPDATTRKLRHDINAKLNLVGGFVELALEAAPEAPWTPELRHVLSGVWTTERSLRYLLGSEGEPPVTAQSATTQDMVASAMRSVTSPATRAVNARRECGRVLVVDDDPANRMLLARRLEKLGHRVRSVASAAEGKRLLDEATFDLVVLDLIMPEVNGFEMLEWIREQPSLAGLPVVMVSAYDDVASVARGIELGADEFLPKSVHPTLLRVRVATCLERKRLRDRERLYLEQLRGERERSDRVLLSMLPKSVAERLKTGERSVAQDVDDVTVLFADLVQFTEFAARTDARTAVNRLNEVFGAFDTLVERHGLEKIKTIGDAYMLVGGVPGSRADHTRAAANAALEMRRAIAELSSVYADPMSLRIGIHCGPVVAGVIGRTRFTYDIWGDTVNVASRMESQGLPGEIQVSLAVEARLRAEYVLTPRGSIEIKGRGQMQTFLLEGPRGAH